MLLRIGIFLASRSTAIPDRFASMPIGNAEIANCIFRKAVEAFAEGLVIDFFLEC